MPQRAIPCLFMRGGTSRGPFINRHDLPRDPTARDRVLLAVMGSPDARQIDGLGGATTVTSKVAIVGVSRRSDADVDYLFAQVDIERPIVDTQPTCGNMIAGVGPFAIETGLIRAEDPVTRVRIYSENTGAVVEAVVKTPNGDVEYDGDVRIDGVPGAAAPVVLNFSGVVGGKTGKLLPTGRMRERIEDIEMSCLDVSMPMVLIRAADLGLRGDEQADDLEGRQDLFARIERIRQLAGQRMGFADVRDTVIPKVGLLSSPVAGGTIRSRYLTPHKLHPAHAVTGGICVAAAACLPGTIAHDLAAERNAPSGNVVIEHPSGTLEIVLETATTDAAWTVVRAGVLRTARKIMSGHVYVRERDWTGQ